LADTTQSAVPEAVNSDLSPAAYQRLLPRIMAVQEERTINVDVLSVVLMTMAKLPGIYALRDVLVTLKDFDVAGLEDLDDVTRALLHSHGLYLQATKAPASLQSLVARSESLRDLFWSEAQTQIKRGNINPDSLREVKRSTGHRVLLTDLQILHTTLSEALPKLAGKTSITQAELDEVVLLIDTLAGALGNREYTQAAQQQATVIRAKAFTLLASIYDEVRAAVLYVRRKHEDGDEIAPSLYANRTAGTKRPPEEETPDPTTGVVPVAPPAPSPTAPSLTEELSSSLAQNGPIRRSGSAG
jgi:hypothetical protein